MEAEVDESRRRAHLHLQHMGIHLERIEDLFSVSLQTAAGA
jgi:hypothetical protein